MRVKGRVNRGVTLQERLSVEFIAHHIGQYLDTPPWRAHKRRWPLHSQNHNRVQTMHPAMRVLSHIQD